jgi:hypothetical protein
MTTQIDTDQSWGHVGLGTRLSVSSTGNDHLLHRVGSVQYVSTQQAVEAELKKGVDPFIVIQKIQENHTTRSEEVYSVTLAGAEIKSSKTGQRIENETMKRDVAAANRRRPRAVSLLVCHEFLLCTRKLPVKLPMRVLRQICAMSRQDPSAYEVAEELPDYNLAQQARKVLKQVHPCSDIEAQALQVAIGYTKAVVLCCVSSAARMKPTEECGTPEVTFDGNIFLAPAEAFAGDGCPVTHITRRSIQNAAHSILPGEMRKMCKSEGGKAVCKYSSGGGGDWTRSQRSGLQVGVNDMVSDPK